MQCSGMLRQASPPSSGASPQVPLRPGTSDTCPVMELDTESVKRLFKGYYKIMSLPPRRVKSMCQLSGRIRGVALAATYVPLLVWAAFAPAAANASKTADPPSCKLVRISDIGWTDVTATTAL